MGGLYIFVWSGKSSWPNKKGKVRKNIGMGVVLHLGPDDSSPCGTTYCNKSFFAEIVTGGEPGFFNLDNIFTEEEKKLLYPDYHLNTDNLNKYRHFNARQLKDIFVKIFNHLKENSDKMPLTHLISDNNGKTYSSSSDRFEYNGEQCYLYGFHNDLEHRDELEIKPAADTFSVAGWIKAMDKLLLGEKEFVILTRTKFEQYKDNLQELIGICDNAIESNKKLLWLFST